MGTPFATAFHEFVRTVGPTSRLRLAPTPSGYLHLGNAYNFILNWVAARHTPGARILLRVDDLDAERKRPEYVQDVFDTLEWLGLDWDDGPHSAADFEANWSQHYRLPLYERALEQLRHGGHLFACGKSRRDLAPFGGDYPLHFREQTCSLNDPDVAWRIKTPVPRPPGLPPDFVVRRRDGIPAYQVASVADDLHLGITHVVRGADLADSTAAQRYLAGCMGQPEFANIRFLHHPLLLNDSGEKLSKSAGAAALKTHRDTGLTPAAVYRGLARWLGLEPVAETSNGLLEIIGR
ncbi:MAG: glutamate--tRNA ligase family protein [Saprospiraceae bacterium]